MILDYFEESEEEIEINGGQCCDVCSMSEIREVDTCECKEEIAAVLKVVRDFPNKGTKKVYISIEILTYKQQYLYQC